MSESKFKFEELKVYGKAIDFIDSVYSICDSFPISERFFLTSQYTGAASSIALNIAEGSADTDNKFNRYLKISLGFLNECAACSTIARTQNYVIKKQKINSEMS